MSDVHVRVRIGAESYALAVQHVIEIGEIGALTVAPGASPATLGVRNLRGDVLPVFDLAALLGVSRSDTPMRMVVAERRDTRAGLAVDEVTDVGELPVADQQTEAPLLSGATLVDETLVGVIDVDVLFDTLEGVA
jgi:chemotaxis signal transduction protein